jgi:hypothetical protein
VSSDARKASGSETPTSRGRTPEELDRIVEILSDVLEEPWQELGRRNAALASN